MVFLIPFGWMLSTSFKESEDISLAAGIRWMPRVNVTHDYMDEDKPLVTANLRGRAVKAQIIEVQGDGGLLFTMAVVVFVSAALVAFLRRHEVPVVGHKLV